MNTELEKVLCIDPMVNVEESYRTKEVVYKSGVNKSVYLYTADSNSDQNWIWNNITPPSLSTVTKRGLRIRYSLLVAQVWVTTQTQLYSPNAVTGAGAQIGAAVNYGFGMVPRACGIQASASSIELRLNGSATSISSNDYACLYPHIIPKDDLIMYSSEFPMQKDDLALYAPTNYTSAETLWQSLDFRNPFNNVDQQEEVTPRGAYLWTQVQGSTVAGTFSYAVYQITLTETLFVSPMLYGKMLNDSAGLANINNLILNVRFQDINRMISVVPGAYAQLNTGYYVTTQNSMIITVNGAPVTINSGANFSVPTLIEEFVTQDPILSARMPSTLSYDYELLQPYITPIGNWVNTTADVTGITLQSLRLASIPSKFYIYAKPAKGSLTPGQVSQTTPDTFLRIKNISINFNNRVNLLNTFTEEDLYNMSVDSGLSVDSFNDWKYYCGSVCIIDVAKYLCLEADECVGQANKYSTLQVTVSFSASPLAYVGNTTAIAYNAYITTVSPGKCFITPSECQYILTGPSSAEVLALTSNLDRICHEDEMPSKALGGNILNTTGKLFKSGLKLFNKITPEHLEMAKNIVGKASDMLGSSVTGGATVGGNMMRNRTY
jgi:hypothetical protein